MKKRILPLITIVLFFTACTPDISVGVERHPLLKFTADSFSWTADNYFFAAPSRIVAYPANATQSGKLYNRLTLEAFGKDDKGNDLQFNLAFDVADATQLIGIYRPSYTTDRGLAQVQLFNLDNNNLAAYELCTSDTTAMLQIKRQSETEQLVAGDFQMMVCNTRDTTQKIAITNGVITDIHY